jgi:hypothetical protein
MLLGLVVGTFLTLVSFPLVFSSFFGIFVYIVGLIPVRIFEWWLIIRWFYGAPEGGIAEMKTPIILGVVCSFALDIPAIIGVVYAASFWIC